MKRGRKFLNTNGKKVTAFVGVIVTLSLATLVTTNYILKRNTDVLIDLPHDLPNQTSGDSSSNVVQSEPVETKKYVQLQASEYELNNETKTISFLENIEKGRFCISTNPEGPEEGDKWIKINSGESYTIEDLENFSDEEKKVYVYYMAGATATYATINVGDIVNYTPVKSSYTVSSTQNGYRDATYSTDTGFTWKILYKNATTKKVLVTISNARKRCNKGKIKR